MPKKLHPELPHCKPDKFLVDMMCDIILNHLEGAEKKIMELRFGKGLKKPLTPEQIGMIIGADRTTVRNAQERALLRIKRALRYQWERENHPKYTIKIKDLGLPPRTRNALIANGIIYIEQVLLLSDAEIMLLPGVGVRGRAHLHRKLTNLNMGLPHKITNGRLKLH